MVAYGSKIYTKMAPFKVVLVLAFVHSWSVTATATVTDDSEEPCTGMSCMQGGEAHDMKVELLQKSTLKQNYRERVVHDVKLTAQLETRKAELLMELRSIDNSLKPTEAVDDRTVILCMFGWVIVCACVIGRLGEFQVYFADNVLLMLVACSSCYLGGGLIPSLKGYPILKQFIGLCVNWLLSLLFWFVCKKRIRIPASGSSGSDQVAQAADADEKSAWSHILNLAPWIARVGAINLFQTFHDDWLVGLAKNEKYLGKMFMLDLAAFIVLWTMLWYASKRWKKAYVRGRDLLSLPVFILDLVQGSLLSCSGKALHFVLEVLVQGVAGPNYEDQVYPYTVAQLVLTMLATFFLGYLLPRFSLKTEDDQVSHTVLAYLFIYTWAFSFVSYLWWLFYTYWGRDLLYWGMMALCLIAAVGVAKVTGNFYGGPSEWSKTFANMLCWTINFGVWWGWCQIMADTNAWAMSRFGIADRRLQDFCIVVILTALTSIVYFCNDHKDMLLHDEAKENPIPSEAVAFGRETNRSTEQANLHSSGAK